MTTSQNGWPALVDGDRRLYIWTIPTKHGDVRIRLRNGSAGFLIAHYVLWYAEVLEPVVGKVLDDWGWAYRPVRGAVVLSNHASGTAADINATKYPLGTDHMSRAQKARIRLRLKFYRGCLRWGGDYHNRLDQMHVEIDRDLAACEKRARRLMNSPRGRRILKANPSQRAVILS